MRRLPVFVAGAAAAAVGTWIVIRSGILTRARQWVGLQTSPGTVPGALGSRINSWLNQPLYAQMAEELDLQPDDELLDVGCGWGAFLAEHGERAAFVAGLDLSPAKVSLARRKLVQRIAAGTAEVAEGDAADLPWPDGRFSVVTTMDAIGWFPDPARALREMYRVLRPGGRAVLQMGFGRVPETRVAMGGLVRILSEDDVRQMTEAAGYTDVTISYLPTAGDWRLYDRILRLWGWEEMRIVHALRSAVAGSPAPDAKEPIPVSGAA